VVVLAAHYVTGGFSQIGPLLSVPIFVLVLGAVVLIFGRGDRRALRQSLVRSGCGLGVGLILSAVATRLLGSILHGVSALDTITYVSVTALLLLIVLSASYSPARRASKTDPLRALRCE
jgi:ABC-type antimicrobial peptide transport system permease subunit